MCCIFVPVCVLTYDFPRWQHFIWRIFIDPPVDTKESLDHIMTEGGKTLPLPFPPLTLPIGTSAFLLLDVVTQTSLPLKDWGNENNFFCMTLSFSFYDFAKGLSQVEPLPSDQCYKAWFSLVKHNIDASKSTHAWASYIYQSLWKTRQVGL